jgi:hypothetical protein
MIDATVALIRRWTTQDVARTNAAQASARLRLRRLQIEDAEEYVARLTEQRFSDDVAPVERSVLATSEGHLDER